MPHYTATIPSSWTREQTFNYLADFRTVAEWDPSMESVELLSGEPGHLGARYRLVMSLLGKSTELEYEATEVQPPERFVMRCDTDKMLSVDTVTVAADAAVTYEAELDLKGALKLAEPVAQVGLTRASDRARDSLKEKLSTPR